MIQLQHLLQLVPGTTQLKTLPNYLQSTIYIAEFRILFFIETESAADPVFWLSSC